MEHIAFLLVMNAALLPMAVIGIALCFGKGADLVAGYNTSSLEEKARWNEKALCRGTGTLVLLIMGCIELSLAGAILENRAMLWTGISLLVPVTAGGLVFINKSGRFKN